MTRTALALLLACFTPLLLRAQQPAEEPPPGVVLNAGTILRGSELTGYYVVYGSEEADSDSSQYTLTLLDRNLDELGRTTYRDDEFLNFSAISYNGQHLAVIYHRGAQQGNFYLDVIDGSGKALLQRRFGSPHGASLRFLRPTEEGFTYGFTYRTQSHNDKDEFSIVNLAVADDRELWKVTSAFDPTVDNYFNYLGEDGDQLLIAVSHLPRKKKERTYSLVGLDKTTGAETFRFGQPARDLEGYYLLARPSGDAFHLLRTWGTAAFNNIPLAVERWTRAGKMEERGLLKSTDAVTAYLGQHQLPPPPPGMNYLKSGEALTTDGHVMVALETWDQRPTRTHFGDAYVGLYGPGGALRQVLPVPKATNEILNGLLGLQQLGMGIGTGIQQVGRDLRSHGGPLSYAGSHTDGGLTLQFFFDREFLKEGVRYRNLHVVYYRDGRLGLETIPFTTEARLVRVLAAQRGYLAIFEGLPDGSLRTRLERLNF